MKNALSLFIGAIILLLFNACAEIEDEKDSLDENETEISSLNDISHNFGQDCTASCHASGGSGEYVFTAAGSVYNSAGSGPYTGTGYVKLYSGSTLVKSIAVDASGNFYTTEAVGSFTLPKVDLGGTVTAMTQDTSSGACATCHVSGGSGKLINGATGL